MSIDHGKLLALCDVPGMPDQWDATDGYMHGWNDCLRALAQPAEAVECNRNCDCVGECKAGIEGVGKPAEAVEGPLPPEAVEVFPSALNGGTALPGDWAIPRAPGINRIVDARMAYGWNECRKEMRRRLTLAAGDDVTDAAQGAVAEVYAGAFGIHYIACADPNKLPVGTKLYTHPQAAPAQGDGEMAKIGHLIATQDNRITEAPIFIVQQKRWICGVDPDYGGERVWINHARESVEITDDAEIARLDAEYAEEYTAPEGYTLTGKMHVWDFVTACFTEQGCKDYLARDGHNLCEPRIYAAGSYRNEEWRSVRKFLMSLAAAPSPEPQS